MSHNNPYTSLPQTAFWKTGVNECDPSNMLGLYRKKFNIQPDDIVATAGSCFAQRISQHMKKHQYRVADFEPRPNHIPAEQAVDYGYDLYSARYGNIYTVHQLLQLAMEANNMGTPKQAIWSRDGRYFDALRPSIEPDGFDSVDALTAARKQHLQCVKSLFAEMDVFIFTLGLTETWRHKQSRTVYPVAPGVIAGSFNDSEYEFVNYSASEVKRAFEEFVSVVTQLRGKARPDFRVILTVSPVPLTATASSQHVLQASCYSKSVLRAVAGELHLEYDNVDYFPSFEIITNQTARGEFFQANFRSIESRGVDAVMAVFFDQHQNPGAAQTPANSGKLNQQPALASADANPSPTAIPRDQCDEVLLDAFVPGTQQQDNEDASVLFIGDSHLAAVKQATSQIPEEKFLTGNSWFIPINWLCEPWSVFKSNDYLRDLTIQATFATACQAPPRDLDHSQCTLVMVGMSVMGDGIIRAFGNLHAGNAEVVNGQDITPTLPLFNNEESSHVTKRYENFYAHHFKNLNTLNACGIYRDIVIIESPDMTENCARYRLGDAFVNSGSYWHYKQVARKVVTGLAKKTHITVIEHPELYLGEYGFSKNEYASTDKPWDIHVNSNYYKPALNRLLDVMQSAPATDISLQPAENNVSDQTTLRRLSNLAVSLSKKLRN